MRISTYWLNRLECRRWLHARALHSLAFDPARSRLVVGLGPKLSAESQYVGECSLPVPCDCNEPTHCPAAQAGCNPNSNDDQGLYVYYIATDAPAQPTLEAALSSATPGSAFDVGCIDVSIRPRTDTQFFVDVGGGSDGFHVAEGLLVAPPHG